MARRVFLLSPAHTGGRRAKILLSPWADFPLARQLRAPGGAPLGDVMAFLSGLYFRGKLAYARRFAADASAVLVITAGADLLPPEARVTPARLRAFARCEIDAANPRFREPLLADARALGPCAAVLLGSVASKKYVTPLLEVFGDRLLFPGDFVGRGDMSRGGLLLRRVAEGCALDYEPVRDAVRRGPRPPKLAPLPRRPARWRPGGRATTLAQPGAGPSRPRSGSGRRSWRPDCLVLRGRQVPPAPHRAAAECDREPAHTSVESPR